MVIVDKSLGFEMVVTLGCCLLSRHFKTLMFNSSLLNSFPKPMRWLTMCVNIFWASIMDSPYYILNNLYSCINVCFLALFTSLVPSYVTSSTSHKSFALLHWEIMKKSYIFNADIRMFLTTQSYRAFFFLSSVQRFQGLSTYFSSFMIVFQIP